MIPVGRRFVVVAKLHEVLGESTRRVEVAREDSGVVAREILLDIRGSPVHGNCTGKQSVVELLGNPISESIVVLEDQHKLKHELQNLNTASVITALCSKKISTISQLFFAYEMGA